MIQNFKKLKLEQIDIVYLILRIATIVGTFIWINVNPEAVPVRWQLYLLLGSFFLYSSLFYAFAFYKPQVFKSLYLLLLLPDLLFVTMLIHYTGEARSYFALGYVLLVSLHAFYYGLKVGVGVAALTTFIDIGHNLFQKMAYQMPIKGHWSDIAARLTFVWIVAVVGGLIAEKGKRDKERMENLNRELEEKYANTRVVFSSTADGLMLFDKDDRLVHVNPAAEKMLGIKQSEIIGRKVISSIKNPDVSDLVGAGDSSETKEESSKKLTETIVQEVAIEGDPKRFLKVLTNPIFDDKGNYLGYVRALHDITTEKEIDEMKNEFVSTVSHELRTPLTSIKGYVDLILEGDAGEINETQREFLEIVKQNNDRLVGLINDFLDISRIESGRVHFKIKPVQLEEIVQNAIDTFRSLMEQKEMKLEVSIPDNLPPVAADFGRISQVIINLISNAIKYTPAKGKISVAIESQKDKLIARVADTGVGISEEDQRQLFSKFYRVDTTLTREVGGSGLGLSICKTIMELHGGKIWVESEVGKGSTFFISIPIYRGEKEEEKELEMISAKRGGKILVIDSEPEIANLIERYLIKDGYSVVKASNGEEAIKAAIQERPDLITLDIMMKDKDGFELLTSLKDNPKTSNIPVVILSIVSDEHKGLRLGAADYLTKPIDQEKLTKVIKSILGKAERRKILIVDDDKDLVNMLSNALKMKGFRVCQAYDGLEAIKVVKKQSPSLILLDLRMPEMDGYQVIEKLKKSKDTEDIPIVIMTAYQLDKKKTDVLKLAADQLSKPLPIDSLASKVEEIIKGVGE